MRWPSQARRFEKDMVAIPGAASPNYLNFGAGGTCSSARRRSLVRFAAIDHIFYFAAGVQNP
jgi:hypothetical protein